MSSMGVIGISTSAFDFFFTVPRSSRSDQPAAVAQAVHGLEVELRNPLAWQVVIRR